MGSEINDWRYNESDQRLHLMLDGTDILPMSDHSDSCHHAVREWNAGANALKHRAKKEGHLGEATKASQQR